MKNGCGVVVKKTSVDVVSIYDIYRHNVVQPSRLPL